MDPTTIDPYPPSEFDLWAETYDQTVFNSRTFPFIGYNDILDSIVKLSEPRTGLFVLDLGTGTGNLASRFFKLGCKLWGTDFSSQMLEKARIKLPNAHFFQHDLRNEWPPGMKQIFDRIVSAYVFHHFKLEDKVSIIKTLVSKRLAPGGRIIIGDIAFPNQTALEKSKFEAGVDWEQEYYWLADDSLLALKQAGLTAEYSQISSCAGVYVIRGS